MYNLQTTSNMTPLIVAIDVNSNMTSKITGAVNTFRQAFMVSMFMNGVLWLPCDKHHDINCSLDVYNSTQNLNTDNLLYVWGNQYTTWHFSRSRYAAVKRLRSLTVLNNRGKWRIIGDIWFSKILVRRYLLFVSQPGCSFVSF